MLLHKCFHRQQNLPQLNTENVFSNGYLQVPSNLRLTEINPPIEERVYVRAPSVTKVPFKKSRRTNRKQSKKPWRFKNTPKAWQHLAKMPGWEKLSKDDQMKLKVGWPDRHFCLSYKEISSTFDCSKRHAKRKISQWEMEGELKVEQEYLERRGKLTKIHKRNFCVFTDQGKKHIAELVEFLHADSKMSPRKDLPKGKNFCQVDSQVISTERKSFLAEENLEFENPADYHKFLDESFNKLLDKETPLKPEFITILEMSGFGYELRNMASWLRKEVNTRPIKELIANLKWHEKKKKKKWRCRSFWASFVWVMKNGIPIGWMKKRAEEYHAAIRGDTRVDGIDSQAVVEMIIELQKKTGIIASKRDLHGLLCHGAIHLKSFLKIVLFKSNRTPIRNWIGNVHFLAKKSTIELSNMYKSEEQIQAKREADDSLLRGARNHSNVAAWEKVIADFEEEDKVIAVGESPEMWD